MAEGSDGLLYKPTWAIASTCAIFILGSLMVERTIYFVGHLLIKFKQSALQEAFEKVKEELMMVGFISIALTIGQQSFSKICVPTKWSTTMPLCNKETNGTSFEERMTLAIEGRRLATAAVNESEVCSADHTLFMPAESFHQLHILIFMLAIVHVMYTLVIVTLGMWSVSHWKAWEERANTKEALSAHGGVRLTRETTFMRAHIVHEWRANTVLSYVVAFFQQFHNIISETDYHTLRKGFIKNHMPSNPNFDFHKYIRRSLQDDFKYVVGISPGLWAYALVWMLLNVDGWESNIVITAIPLLLVLAIGTKLQHIMTKMAVHFNNKHPLTLGVPMVKPNDNLFWFNRPRFILLCIHFILFQNALEISFDLWAAITFSPDNCLYRQPSFLIGRIVIGLVVQMTCGIITLPIYALVSQMGSNVKKTIFKEHIQRGLRNWHKRAKERIRRRESGEGRSSRPSTPSRPPTPTPSGEGSSNAQRGHTVELVLHAFPDVV
ncbi:hypothetical protein GOP47_0025422 [Adiantum capillus-veneris]|uniref:MLO-like protein n=1 Tax=Adiantum capillus-veneris TaxID=13818 RepID=A0A9D4U1A1_ADICA|nr:hypothetical protein GOP47_0025422 [Adiantum capillus-veneris]